MLQSADIATLLVADFNSCGIGSYDSRATPTGLAKASCAKGYYSFGHEIGHILGAMHNRGNGGANYDYSFGWLIENPTEPADGGFRTIMA